MRTFRLLVGHVHEPGRPLHKTNVTFTGKTLIDAEAKAERFFTDGKFHHMGWTLEEEQEVRR